jgi:hypothetical protein
MSIERTPQMVGCQSSPGNAAARWRAALALTAGAAVLGLTAGCNGAATPTSLATSPTASPAVEDATASVVGPDGSETTATGPSTAATPSSPTSVGAADPTGVTTGAGGGSSAGDIRTGNARARTTPGIADGATALPPAASVAEDARCRASSLVLEPLDLQGSPGGTYANFRLRNRSGGSCAVRGYVGATLIGDDGKDIATAVRHEDGPNVWVTVAKGGSAQFHLRFPNPYSGDAPCNPPNAARVRVTLAGVSGSLTGATPEGGIQACGGRVSTAPVGST